MCKQPAENAPSPKTRAKNNFQRSSARGNSKTAPKQEKITNARVLLRANDVRGVQMKSVTFAPLTSEVDDCRSTNKHRTIHWKRDVEY
jgi:hypothetical protein